MSHAELADETNAKSVFRKGQLPNQTAESVLVFLQKKNTARKQCFYFTIDSDTLPFCTSTPSTHTVTMSPTDTTSRGCLTN